MKCVWAEYQDNDTSYCLENQIGKVIQVHIQDSLIHASIGGKMFERLNEFSYSSERYEIDYWLYNTHCVFYDDFSKLRWVTHDLRMKEFNGKWKKDKRYYSSNLESPVFSSKKEFELEWDANNRND